MLRPHDMSSVIIAGPKSVQEPVIKELHGLKVLHIVEHSKSDLADIGIPLENAPRLSEILVRVRALASALNIKDKGGKFELSKDLLEIESSVRKINDELNAGLGELKKIELQVAKIEPVKRELELIKDINIPLEYFGPYRSISYFSGHLKSEPSQLREAVSKITKSFLLLEAGGKGKNFIVLFVDGRKADSIAQILKKMSFSHADLANARGMKGTAAENLKRIVEESSKLQRDREIIKGKVEKLAIRCGEFLIASEKFLSEQLEKAEVPLKFASTPNSFLAKGWIPTAELRHAIERLNKAGQNKIYIQFEPARKQDKAPIKQKNPKAVEPLQFFMDLYSMPSYHEIDPTFFVFLTFPIFFGIMLGDIGYGLVSLVLFWILKRKLPKGKNLFNILMLSSLVSIIFGFLYGEVFGFEELGHYQLWHVLSRAHDIIPLLAITIAIGAIHVNIGLIVGFINVYKSHGLMAAIYEKASWIVLEIGVAMLALSYMNLVSISPWIGAAFLGASILMLFKGEGIKGVMELPGIFTNILSYARLMAIGLSSVKLALVINESAGEMFHAGGIMIIVGILVLVIGHLINLGLGLLGSFLHSLRLHYVEFFSKFFAGGAKKYQPFGYKE